MTYRAGLDALLDPLACLRRHESEFPWSDCSSLQLDKRYRTRQLPLLHGRPRQPIAPEPMAPGEFWPPARSVVVPLPDLHGAEPVVALRDDLRVSDVAPLVWFEGLMARAGKMHATLVPGVPVPDI